MSLDPVKRLIRVIVIVVLVSFDTLVIVKPAPFITAFNRAVSDVVVSSDGTPVTGMGGFEEWSRAWVVPKVFHTSVAGKRVDGPDRVGKPSGKVVAR